MDVLLHVSSYCWGAAENDSGVGFLPVQRWRRKQPRVVEHGLLPHGWVCFVRRETPQLSVPRRRLGMLCSTEGQWLKATPLPCSWCRTARPHRSPAGTLRLPRRFCPSPEPPGPSVPTGRSKVMISQWLLMEKDPLLVDLIIPLLPTFLPTVETGKAVSHEQDHGSSAAGEGTGYRRVQSSCWTPQQRHTAGRVSCFPSLRDPLQPRVTLTTTFSSLNIFSPLTLLSSFSGKFR